MAETAPRSDADFEAFFERHWKYIYRLCLSYLKSEAEAEDCAEDVLVKVLTGNFSFSDETHERKWLTVAAANLCKDRLKSYARTHNISLEEGNLPEPAAQELTGEEEDVWEAVKKLPLRLKDVTWLYYYDGYRTEEIAGLLGRPASTVRNQLKEARDLLKSMLGGETR